MKKTIWLLLLAALLACGPTSPTETQTAVTSDDEETAVSEVETVEEVEEAPETEAVEEASNAETTLPVATNFEAFVPATTVEEAAVIREQDWLKGAAEPVVVIIEYGDFQ